MAKKLPNATEAGRGQRTIAMTIYFHTDNIAKDGDGWIIPRHAWTNGKVTVRANKSHQIKATNPIPFTTMGELSLAIEKALEKADVTLHVSERQARVIDRGH